MSARFTTDIDLSSSSGDPQRDLDSLLAASNLDLGDHLAFRQDSVRLVSGVGARPGKTLHQVKFRATLGIGRVQNLKVEVVRSDSPPDWVDLQRPRLTWPVGGDQAPLWKLLPIPMQLADKVAASFENYRGASSSRAKDLVDILLVALEFSTLKRELREALESELRRRGIPDSSEFPRPASWLSAYPKLASKSTLPTEYHDLHTALALASDFLDLSNTVSDQAEWSPTLRRWLGPFDSTPMIDPEDSPP